MEVLLEGRPDTSEGQAEAIWETLPAAARKSWDDWLRSHPGMRRLELGIRGFFENGGQTAFVTMALVEDGKDVGNKRAFLMDSFDGISAVAMLCCPGLDFSWQTSILEYAGPAGRGDLFDDGGLPDPGGAPDKEVEQLARLLGAAQRGREELVERLRRELTAPVNAHDCAC